MTWTEVMAARREYGHVWGTPQKELLNGEDRNFPPQRCDRWRGRRAVRSRLAQHDHRPYAAQHSRS